MEIGIQGGLVRQSVVVVEIGIQGGLDRQSVVVVWGVRQNCCQQLLIIACGGVDPPYLAAQVRWCAA